MKCVPVFFYCNVRNKSFAKLTTSTEDIRDLWQFDERLMDSMTPVLELPLPEYLKLHAKYGDAVLVPNMTLSFFLPSGLF